MVGLIHPAQDPSDRVCLPARRGADPASAALREKRQRGRIPINCPLCLGARARVRAVPRRRWFSATKPVAREQNPTDGPASTDSAGPFGRR